MRLLGLIVFVLFLLEPLQAKDQFLNKLESLYSDSLELASKKEKRAFLAEAFLFEAKKNLLKGSIDIRKGKKLRKNPVYALALKLMWNEKVLPRMSFGGKELLKIFPKTGRRAIYLGLVAHRISQKMFPGEKEFGTNLDAFRHAYSVSYTHLTLPTICSV